MVYAYTQDVPIDETTYHQIMDRLGEEPLTGSLVHLVVRRSDGGLRYIEVWESEELCARAFEERIHPAVRGVFTDIGFQPDGEPTVNRLDVIDTTGSVFSSPTP